MIILIIVLISILIVGIMFYGTYFGLLMYKDLILKKLAAVDARLTNRQKSVLSFLDATQSTLENEEELYYRIRTIITDINNMPKKWNNNEDRFKLENQLDIELNTLFNLAFTNPKIKNDVYLQRYLQDFIAIQSLLPSAIKEYNETLQAYKTLINSPFGQILAPKLRITCSFVEYYIPS